MFKISIVITTYKREELLKRTLESIAGCIVPDCSINLFVIENGYKGDAENICTAVNSDIPIRYYYLEKSGTSNARGYSLTLMDEDSFVIFFDDDVRVDKYILEAYYSAAKELGRGYYYGGPVYPEYEIEPNLNYIDLFPYSITGYTPFSQRTVKKKLIFLGANWAAFSSDILSAGSFNPDLGPGGNKKMTGHEADIQMRLIEQGCSAVYLPDAGVWHFIASSNLSFDWLKHRWYKNGLKYGFILKNKNPDGFLFFIPKWLAKQVLQDFAMMIIYALFRKGQFSYYEKRVNFYRTIGIVVFLLKHKGPNRS